MAQIIFQGTPTAQTDFNYTPAVDTPVVLYFTGSAYSKKPGSIGYKVFISGQPVTTTQMYSNSAQTHRALNPSLVYYTFPLVIKDGNVQPVAIRIEPVSSETLFDGNDQISLAIL